MSIQHLQGLIRQEAMKALANKTFVTLGTITDFDPINYLALVQLYPEDSVNGGVSLNTGWLPLATPAIGIYAPPNIGDMVDVHFAEGSLQNGYISQRFYGLSFPPSGQAKPGEFWLVNSNGSFINITNDGNITINANGEIKLNPVLSLEYGGTSSNLSPVNGSLFYTTTTVTALLPPPPVSGLVLTSVANGVPAWDPPSGGTGTVDQVDTNNGLTGGPITTVGTIGLAAIANNTLLANISGGSLFPSSTTLSDLIDSAIDNTQGDILFRNSTGWTFLSPSTAGYVLSTGGPAANPSWVPATSGSGTVTSITAGTGLSGGTITTSGTISLTAPVTLALGGTNNISLTASNGGIVWSDASKLNVLAGTATAGLPLLSGSNATPAWGGFPLSLGGTLTTAGALTTSGAFGATFTFTNTTGVTFPTSGTLATTSQLPTPAALTESNDTNVTLTLGGTPSTALLQAVSITAGWTGTLSLARGGTAANLTASNGGIFYSTASAGAILAGTSTASQVLLSGASTAPTWSTATYPSTTTINQLLYSGSANVISGLATVNSAGLLTNSGGVPGWVAYTGTGAPVLAVSPTLTGTVTFSALKAASNGVFILDNTGEGLIQLLTGGGTCVNYVSIASAATTVAPAILASGTDTNIVLQLSGKGTGGVGTQGTTAAGNATAGNVGEFVSATLAVGSGVSLVSTTNKDVLSISLTAGDWDVWGNVLFSNSSTLITNCYGWTSSTSATTPDTSLVNGLFIAAGGIAQIGVQTPYKRYNLAATTTIYLSGLCTFTGTTTAAGGIFARRAR